VEAAILEFCFYPLDIPSGVKKIGVADGTVDEERIFKNEHSFTQRLTLILRHVSLFFLWACGSLFEWWMNPLGLGPQYLGREGLFTLCPH